MLKSKLAHRLKPALVAAGMLFLTSCDAGQGSVVQPSVTADFNGTWQGTGTMDLDISGQPSTTRPCSDVHLTFTQTSNTLDFSQAAAICNNATFGFGDYSATIQNGTLVVAGRNIGTWVGNHIDIDYQSATGTVQATFILENDGSLVLDALETDVDPKGVTVRTQIHSVLYQQ